MSVLARSRNTDSSGPVVIEVGQLVRQLLEVLRLQGTGVLQHVIARGVDGPLPYRLTHQEEVVPDSKFEAPTECGGMCRLTSPAGSPRRQRQSRWEDWTAETRP